VYSALPSEADIPFEEYPERRTRRQDGYTNNRFKMSISVQDQYQASVIQIKGKFLGSVDGPELKQKLDDLKQTGKTNIVIDLGQTDFMDSSGIGALISGLTTMRKSGGDVRLANMEKRIQGLFVMTRLLGPVFDDYESVDAAVESFKTNPPEKASQ
jgi:anti-sigma B factor antagonist